MNYLLIPATPFGRVGIVWDVVGGEPKVQRVLLARRGHPARDQIAALYPDARPAACGTINTLAKNVAGLLSGEAVDFDLELADLARCSRFQQLILRAEHAIPRGRVSTYGLIARHLGRPHAARAVGNALAANPFPLIVPCHRAIRADGRLGGYQGGTRMKRFLLESEGITFDRAGRVAGMRLHYRQAR